VWLQVIINGLLMGGFFASTAMGFSIVWGVMDVVNSAHGAFIMLGAYVTYALFTVVGLDPFLSIPIAMLVLFVIGFLTQKYILNLIMKTSVSMSFVLTWGLDILLINIALILFTANWRSVSPSYAGAHWAIGSATISHIRAGVLAVSILLMYLLSLFMSRTKMGKAILATAFDKDAARLVGVDIGHIYAVTLGIGSALAGAAGAMTSMIYPISPQLGLTLIAKAFVVTALGGLGDMRGVIVGGLVLGLAESIGVAVVGPEYQMALDVLMLVAMLILRPQGILGKKYYG
jgi:branched-chain amino acid transport system permease protein